MLIKDANAGLSMVPEPVRLNGRCTTYRALFGKQYRGVRVGDIVSDLHLPALRHLSDDVLKAAKLFTRDMIRQSFEPLQDAEGLILYGPYPHRDERVFHSGGKRAGGWQGNQPEENEAADFILQGTFIAKRGHMLPNPKE